MNRRSTTKKEEAAVRRPCGHRQAFGATVQFRCQLAGMAFVPCRETHLSFGCGACFNAGLWKPRGFGCLTKFKWTYPSRYRKQYSTPEEANVDDQEVVAALLKASSTARERLDKGQARRMAMAAGGQAPGFEPRRKFLRDAAMEAVKAVSEEASKFNEASPDDRLSNLDLADVMDFAARLLRKPSEGPEDPWKA